jgi:ribonuclease HI
MKKVIIYTDGACSGNPGPGGWGAVLLYGERRREISGFELETTNNRMELTAAIRALSMLKQSCEVELHSDSAYLIGAFEQGWIVNWKAENWHKKNREPVKNSDLWQELARLAGVHSVCWVKVKGHSDSIENKRCDLLATGEIKRANSHREGLREG